MEVVDTRPFGWLLRDVLMANWTEKVTRPTAEALIEYGDDGILDALDSAGNTGHPRGSEELVCGTVRANHCIPSGGSATYYFEVAAVELLTNSNDGEMTAPKYESGDVVGCGVHLKDGTAFFTKNSKRLGGAAFRDVRGQLYPAVSFLSQTIGAKLTVNFAGPFMHADALKDVK
ncbi:hypothetical protein EDB80DRAFT_881429 [Ilyonectria destructans]|nr:hypothetical protein EDB80DRAFT_881429 [Ilyonectria destructans]